MIRSTRPHGESSAPSCKLITYREFLPLLLGPEALSPCQGYDPSVDATSLPAYNDAREQMGLARVASFDQIGSDREVQGRLAAVYASVDDIDLWVGGLAEDDVAGAMVGPLFFEILKTQTDLETSMKTTLMVVLSTVVAGSQMANADQPAWYGSLNLGVALPDGELIHDGAKAAGAPTYELDNGGIVGIGAGYALGNGLRLEGELRARGFDAGGGAYGTGGRLGGPSYVDGTAKSTTLMANLVCFCSCNGPSIAVLSIMSSNTSSN